MRGNQPDRSIVHMDLDAFFVSVERLKDRRLHGLPVMIGGTGDRAVVAACSYEARRFGVHAAMPMRMARRLCPHGIVISGDYDAYTEQSRIVTEIIHEAAPMYEKASIDEFYLDLSGMERFYGTYRWARELRQRVMRETGLPLSMGLSVNKMMSKVATSAAKPNDHLQVAEPEVQPFLAPLPVRRIPYLGLQTARQLAFLGVRRILTLREIPKPVLQRAFGRQGHFLYHRSRGEDDSPVQPYRERQSISTEATFADDTMDLTLLHSRLSAMVEQLAHQLRQQGRLTACVTVKLRYANFETITRQARIAYTANDEVLWHKVRDLFQQLYQKRVRIRLLGVRFSELVPGGTQMQLFASQARQVELYSALDHLRSKHGTGIIWRGNSLLPDSSPGPEVPGL